MIQIILILLLSIPIFQYRVYWLLIDKLGIAYSYFIDQFLPLTVTGIAAFIVIRRNIPITVVKRYLISNAIPFLVIIVSVLVVHGRVLGNYFMGEEPTTILSGLNTDSRESLVRGILRGYHYGIYALSYQLFYTNAMLYNFVSLVLYIFSAIIFYVFLNQLFNKKIMPALVGALFFVITPAYMDMFFWQSNFSGMPIALSAGILSLIFLLAYQKNSKLPYYLLSLMFYLSMLKIGFVRLHAFIALPLYMCLFPLSLHFQLDIKRFILKALPFLSIFTSFLLTVFILPDHVFETGVTVKGQPLNYDGYLVVLSMLIAYLFIPSELANLYYPKVSQFLSTYVSGSSGYISITMSLGLLFGGILLILFFIGIKNIRQDYGRLIIFALITIFAHLVLTPLFIQGYNDVLEIDRRFSFTGAGNGPGIRYVFVSAVGVSMLLAVITYWIVTKPRKYRLAFFALIFLLFGYYVYLNTTSYISALKNINPGQSAVPNGVFSMVPRDGQKKLLYSANPEYNAIEAKIGDWLHAFYKPDELKYTNSLEDVRKNIASGMYERNNFYAFYNNTHTQSFKDISALAKNELYDNEANQKKSRLISQETNSFTQSANLATSFLETDNPSFPLILHRGIYVSGELNQRLLLPRELSFLIRKKSLPSRYPYIDAFKVIRNRMWQNSPFPMNVWDMLKNKPLFVEEELNLALSVVSLNNHTINELPSRSRIEIARDLIRRESAKDKEEIIMSDIEKVNKYYIDSQEILNTFFKSPSFNSLALIYACAEDIDWEKQKKSSETIGGIWYVKELSLSSDKVNEEISTSLTCFGSVLRQIILVGPPIPSEFVIQDISF